MTRRGYKLTQPYIDAESQYLITMTPEHHIRQLGGAYCYSLITSLTAGATLGILITAPATGLDELTLKVIDVQSDAIVQKEVYENVTVSSAGTGITLVNQNRKIETEALTVITKNPTVSGGTLLRTTLHGTVNSLGRFILSVPPEETGWQLAPNSNFYVKITNTSGTNATNVALLGFLYEIVR